MVSSSAKTVGAYLKSLPPERKKVIEEVRKVILKNLPKGYVERMNWGMITYEIPLSTYPVTYNNQPLSYGGLAAQKNNYSVYMMSPYVDKKIDKWFKGEFKKRKLPLNMGKGCVRFTKIENLPLDVIGTVFAQMSVKDYIAYYEKSRHFKKKK